MRFLLLALASGACVPLAAQTVWTVTSPTGIPAAISAAQPGDVIDLRPNASWVYFEPFTLTKGLVIRGNGSRVGYQPSFTQFELVVRIPQGQVAVLDDLDLTSAYSPFGSGGTTVQINTGTVHIEDCALSREDGPSLLVSNASLTVSSSSIVARNELYGSNGAIVATNSHVTLRDCTVIGGNASCHAIDCGVSQNAACVAIRAADSTLHVERCQITGGSHATGAFSGVGATAITLDGSTRAWIADSTATGGVSGGSRAPAIVNNSTSPVELRNTQLVGGPPSAVGPITPNAPLLRMELQPLWQRGMTTTLTLHGDPSMPFAVWWTRHTAVSTVPAAVEPIWVLPTGLILLSGVLDAAGSAVLPIAVPNATALEHVPVFLQASSGATLPLRLSTLAGGVIR
ncbi:MAG: hypothetical protein ACO4CZ_06050 [Planctomycetota bacterium]